MTQREFLNTVACMLENMTDGDYEDLFPKDSDFWNRDSMLDMAKERIKALDKKNSSSSNKPTKKQLENEGIYNNIIEIMSDNVSRTVRQITDIYNSTFDTDLSTNRVQPQVTKAVKNGTLNRTVVKGVVYFVNK